MEEKPPTRRPASISASGDDAPKLASLFGIRRNRLVRFEVQIALDWQAEFAADGLQFDETHIAEFRLAHAEIAEAEGEPVIGIELGQEPGALRIRGEEFDNGFEVECAVAFVHRGALSAAVAQIVAAALHICAWLTHFSQSVTH
jgi:hypothetical protein